MSRSWDVFCRVVDNYGDAAVCWRLSLQLASEQRARVRLWIDELPALRALCPSVDSGAARQTVAGVELRRWDSNAKFDAPAEIAVEAFGCGLPDAYVEAMAAQSPHPVWIILEYLSAEGWVAGHHGLPSPHPRLPLERHFFFPGFVPGTGGVLHEASLEGKREAFQASPPAQERFWKDMGFSAPAASACAVSIFGYENEAAGSFLKMWSQGAREVVVAVPASRIRPQVCAFLDIADPGDGRTVKAGRLEVRFLPFLPQAGYDELLWACDWNFVRGEDSFVRAQWARRPLVWQIYPQKDDIHKAKLDAFLALYSAGLEPQTTEYLCRLWMAWNGYPLQAGSSIAEVWGAVSEPSGRLREHCDRWAGKVLLEGNLAGNLAQFCEERLK